MGENVSSGSVVSRATRARSFGGRLLVLLAAIALAACGTGTSTPSSPPAAGGPTVTGAWVRPPQGMDRPAGAYLVITGGPAADALIGVTSPAAASVEIHETTTDASGMSGMHPIPRLEIPAGTTVTLEPGGYHLMLMGAEMGAMEIGATVTFELTFEQAGVVVVQAEVRAG
jgi:copper(I)-binding protein